jgi:hypothetical protein
MFETHRERLLQSLDVAHAAYYRAETFGGPSLYFHVRALEAAKDADFGRFVESAYALLAAWGMHRMGRGGSKMREFEDFKASLKPLWPVVLRLQQAMPESLDEAGWRELREVFCGIRCMSTGTSLVGNSKVMATRSRIWSLRWIANILSGSSSEIRTSPITLSGSGRNCR